MQSISSTQEENKRWEECPVSPASEVDCRTKSRLIVDCSTGCLRMVSDVSPLVKYLDNLRESAITFGLHLKKHSPVAFTLDRAITRIQEAYDFDCQCVEQVKAFLGTTA